MQSEKNQIQSRVELSLTESNEKMSQILQESRNLEAQRDLLNERNEKLKLASKKIEELKKELEEKQELLAASERKKSQLMVEKIDLEEKEFQL